MSQHATVGRGPEVTALASVDILRILRKRLLLILACFIVLGLGGTAVLVAWWQWWPSYAAEGVVEVDPGQTQMPALMAGYQQTEVPIQLFDAFMQVQVLSLHSEQMLDAALKQLEVKLPDYSGPGGAHNLARDLQVIFSPNTQYISVSLKGRDKEGVQRIVVAVLDKYISQVIADRNKVDADRRRGLEDERNDLRRQVEKLSQDLNNYRRESSVVVTDDRSSEQLAKLTALIRQLTDTQMDLAEAAAAWNQFQELREQLEKNQELTPALLAAFPELMDQLHRDPGILAATENTSRLGQDLQGIEQRFGPKHETVIRLKAAYQTAQNDLQSKQNDVLGQLYQQQAAVLKTKFDRLRGAEADLLNRVAEARAQAVDAARLTADYRGREDELRRVSTLLGTVTDGLERMRISITLTRPNIRILQYPQIPIDPAEPRLLLYIPAALIIRLLLGAGLSLLIEVLDTRLRTPADVVRQIGVPLLGTVPDRTEDERLPMDVNIALASQTVPHSLTAEAFRQFRTNLLFASDRPIKSVLVTSPNPGDGKTTIAANLAVTMARSGNQVLLIEANFRRPVLARALDVPDRTGLSNVLVGLSTAEEAIQATRIENLDVLVGGALPPSPAELLGSQSMKQLVHDQMQRYDHIIIDAAPILVVVDNYLLAEVVDGVVMVVQAGENTRGVAQRAARQLYALRARLLGAVLNRARATKGGYFREAYQAYYDYSGAACPTDLGPVGDRSAPAAVASSEDQAQA